MSRLRELAWISGLRGTHGAGVCQGLATKKVMRFEIEKARHDITYFLWYHDNHDDGNSKILRDYSCNFIMGHVRAATKGNINDENAHPFDTGRYISAHNGTLHDKKYQHETKTDSQVMFEDVERRGLLTTLRDMDKSSAYSIVQFDKQARELSFVTNGKRPLVYCYLKNRRVFFWASEKRQLEFVLAGVNEKSEIFKFTDDIIYSFRPDDVQAGKQPVWDVQKVEPPVVTRPTQDFFRGRPTGPSVALREPATETTQHTVIKLADKGKVSSIGDLVAHSKSKKAEQDRVHKANLLLRRCVYCTREMDLLAQYEGVTIDEGMYCCFDCNEMQQEVINRHSVH
jgi:hypothetical protein